MRDKEKEEKNGQPMVKGRRWKKRLTVLVLIAMFFGGALCLLAQNPRVKMLQSTLYFAENTLKDPSYLAYGLDLMDLFCNYMNGDVTYSGKAHLHSVKGLGFSSSMDVEGERSFSNKEMTWHADMDVLWFDVGEMDLYAREDTLYMVVPMLDGMSQAFVTGQDLFRKAPELTSDLDREWFRDNLGNIVRLMREMEIEETGKTIEDEGRTSKEYRMVIPQGSGDFLWELLGMEAPDHDIVLSVYLTPQNHMRRMEIDLSQSVKGLSLVVDGEHVDRCILTRELPDQERVTMTVVRNGDITYTNLLSLDIAYSTYRGDVYRAEMAVELDPEEEGTKIKVSDLEVKKNEETTLAEGSFEGRIQKTQGLPDLLMETGMDFDAIEKVEWEEIRRDTEGFMQDMVEKAKGNLP